MKNYDKSLVEVWEWKEKVYRDVKELTPKEYVKKVRKNTDKTFSETGINLTSIYPKKEDHKIA